MMTTSPRTPSIILRPHKFAMLGIFAVAQGLKTVSERLSGHSSLLPSLARETRTDGASRQPDRLARIPTLCARPIRREPEQRSFPYRAQRSFPALQPSNSAVYVAGWLSDSTDAHARSSHVRRQPFSGWGRRCRAAPAIRVHFCGIDTPFRAGRNEPAAQAESPNFVLRA
jgi:hypothetical protein